ncbi:MAG: hypothetical protein Q9190_002861 [Brigantiaea leucoxantha]
MQLRLIHIIHLLCLTTAGFSNVNLAHREGISTSNNLDVLSKRETACIALNDCPGEDPDPPASSKIAADETSTLQPGPVPTATSDDVVPISTNLKTGPITTSSPVIVSAVTKVTNTSSGPTPSSSDRAKCSPDECPQFCQPGTKSKLKRSSLVGSLGAQALRKRFFEPTDPNTRVNELLEQSYTSNLSPDPSKYEWFSFADEEYAAAIKGLCGCTAILAASSKGSFTSHIWEEDTNTDGDLQPDNYEATLQTLTSQLSPHKDDLAGGEAWVVLPTQPNNSNRMLYPSEIVDAIKKAVSDASGLEVQTKTYVPLNWKRSPVLGTNERGTAAVQYDPSYKPQPSAESGKAYRLWAEGEKLSEKTNL